MATAWPSQAVNPRKQPGTPAIALAMATTDSAGRRPAHADVDLDDDRQNAGARAARHPAQVHEAVDRDDRICQVEKTTAAKLDRPDDLIGDQDVADSACAMTSASPSLAQVTPIAPAASSLRMMPIVFWPLICGRQ